MKKDSSDIVMFTDGAARGNPGPGGWGTVLVFIHMNNVVELSGYSPYTTNNIMELTALHQGLRYLVQHGYTTKTIHIYSDSEYVVAGITKWVPGWIKRGWKTSTGAEVANQQLWKELYDVWQQLNCSIDRVYGHASVPGNERCDVLATTRADKLPPHEYSGSLDHYPMPDILHIPDMTDQRSQRVKKSTPTHSAGAWYVSLVDGILQRHQTWDQCKARVHRQSAKYKKVASQSQEAQLLREWGVQ